MILVLLGPPGAGKGTQCKRIIEKYKLAHLSSGDILRKERAEGTELGKEAKGYMDSGALVPDDVIIKMMAAAVTAADGNCVLDGFPRTVLQAERLDEQLSDDGKKVDAVVNLVIDDNIVEKRITGRRICPKCGAVYHIDSLRPAVDMICDSCPGQELVQRPDDKPEVVRKRLENYHAQTAAVVGYYAGTSQPVLDIDADDSIDNITARIYEKLDALVPAK